MANNYSTDLEASSSQYWSIADASQSGLDFNGTSFSLAIWAKFESLPGSGDQMCFFGKRNGTGNQRSYYFALYNQAGTYKLLTQLSANGSGFSDYVGSGITIATGAWHHFGFTYTTGTGAYNFYYDSADAGSGTATQLDIYNSTAPFNIGRIDDGVFYLDGLLNDARVYSANIGGTDMGNLYSTPCSPRTSNLVSSWFSTNNDGNDLTGSNNLTNNNSATFSSDVAYSCSVGPANVKTWDGLALASVKTINGLAIASVKSVNGLA